MTNVAYIVSPFRSATGKAFRGSLAQKRPDELCADVIKGVLERTVEFDPNLIEDAIIGCAMPEAEQGMNVARMAVLLAGLPDTVPGVTVNRFCSSGVQTIAMAASRIKAGEGHCLLAGGTESMSLVPMMGHKPSASGRLLDDHPDSYIGMGLTAENVAKDYKISREDQDQFSLESHQKAAKAIEGGLFADEIVPVSITRRVPQAGGKISEKTREFTTDEGPRADTTAAALGKLRAVFKTGGTVTAGNSSQMSDGSGMCLVCSEDFVKTHNLKPIAKIMGFEVAGVPPRVMGIGPVEAIPKVLKKIGWKLADIERMELNEAFAAQALAVMQNLEVNPDIVNPTGGAIALGHPLGATGANLTARLLHGMKRDGQKKGIVSMCIGTGMGAAAAFELL